MNVHSERQGERKNIECGGERKRGEEKKETNEGHRLLILYWGLPWIEFRERGRGGECDEYDYSCVSVCGSNEFRVWDRKGI